MGKISEDMRAVIESAHLCFAATVAPDGSPNLSPKATIRVWDDSRIFFLDIASPTTRRNIESNPRIEVNVVEALSRRGYRFSGTAVIHRDGPVYEEAKRRVLEESRTTYPVEAVILIEVDSARPLVSPGYMHIAREDEMRLMWREARAALDRGFEEHLAASPDFDPGRGLQQGGRVSTVSLSPTHSFNKPCVDSILLVAGIGVEGDVHAGETVRHRSRIARDPGAPNLRQVHLIHGELHRELRRSGFDVSPGRMGENITTIGIDLLALPTGTKLHIGASAVIELTGLRNPCAQLDAIQPGLMEATLAREEGGGIVRRAGVMAIVLTGGIVRPGDPISAEMPPEPHRPLEPV